MLVFEVLLRPTSNAEKIAVLLIGYTEGSGTKLVAKMPAQRPRIVTVG
jgi:hypothetical protein